jgi:hypothetical protein
MIVAAVETARVLIFAASLGLQGGLPRFDEHCREEIGAEAARPSRTPAAPFASASSTNTADEVDLLLGELENA